MATACTDPKLGLQKKEEGVNNNEDEPQNIQGTDPNLGHLKKQGVNNNSKGEIIGDENLDEIPEPAHYYLTSDSESEDSNFKLTFESESSEISDDHETVSGSSEISDDSEDMVQNNNKELLDVVEGLNPRVAILQDKAIGLINYLCDISYKNKHRYVINSVLKKDLEEEPFPTNVMDDVEELLRHPNFDVQSKMIEIKYFPMGYFIEQAETMADVWDEEYDAEDIDETIDTMDELSEIDNGHGSYDHAIVFQGTLLHLAVASGNFELFKVLAPHFDDLNPEAKASTESLSGGSCARGPTTPSWVFAETPLTPDGYMKLTPLIIAAAEDQKDVYDFLIDKIGEENLEKIPDLAQWF